jgi:hypothetical protein
MEEVESAHSFRRANITWRQEVDGSSIEASKIAGNSTIPMIDHLVTGKASTVRNHYNAIRLDIEETGGPTLKLVIEAPAYDGGGAVD